LEEEILEELKFDSYKDKQSSKIHWLFFIAAILTIGFMFMVEDTIDFQLNDTYFVITKSLFYLRFVFLLLLIGLIYWNWRFVKLNRWLKITHITFTLLPIFNIFKESITGHISELNLEMIVVSFISQILFIINDYI
jgi:hypothetical protein